ncbi:MAG TPA: hypothetical protein VHE55_13670 [Fimbriimonadaceae bacterium]|nr:hypothetical protein [Fimbriimonadaceae bacterium]
MVRPASTIQVNFKPFPFRVVRIEGPEGLVAYEIADERHIGGSQADFRLLADWIAWFTLQRDTVLWIRLRSHPLPEWLALPRHEGLSLDLVLAPFHLAIKPHHWKEIRNRKGWMDVSIDVPQTPPDIQSAELRYEEFDWRGMDIRTGVSTLFFYGDKVTFEGLADAASGTAQFWDVGDHWHLDHIARRRDYKTLMVLLEKPT